MRSVSYCSGKGKEQACAVGSPPVGEHQHNKHVSLHRFIKHKVEASKDSFVINGRSKLQRELRAEQLAVSSSLKAKAAAARTSL